ncbi:ATP-dependent Clp protease ATP-binding subunit [Sphingobacterium zeae]|uniref:ATP-dependent Clp protease ATP-binding subunit ClpB n=1 Tax=Sphingobacterium zeae TaxID=1776859 RepID=A0ABU0U829_9SPHI|nr:ATP-dependent Clp protease ATP-binding subunit [Sphingobacterium zeae]MDQ1151113.1 ATP-dependent Clp protease ATP-binding subunit ClpB [Sphingobacterium zeae]
MTISNFSESVKLAIHIAQALAEEYHQNQFGPAHLLKALMHKDVGLRQFVQSIDKDDQYISEWAEVRMDELERSSNVPPAEEIRGNEAVLRLLDEADLVRIKLGLDLITPICVLTAISKAGIAFDVNQLKSFPIKEKEIYDLYIDQNQLSQAVSGAAESSSTQSGEPSGLHNALHQYCIDRLQLVREGKSDPIVGRDREIRMMLEILCRRNKPNVIIAGEAGVGKTALVDGFAIDIVSGHVPEQLKAAQLFELDLGALIAGASYKGEIEDRLKKIIAEIKRFDKAILFIDEIHTLLDSKGPIGSGAGNLLKPELARGEITVIGATTLEEYRKIIEPEQAFSRRFELLQIAEPTEEKAIKMLEKVLDRYEQHHELKVDSAALPVTVSLAKRYLKDRHLPDSAFDLMDRSMAALKLAQSGSLSILEQIDDEFQHLRAELQQKSEREQFGAYKWLTEALFNRLSPILLGMLNEEERYEDLESAQHYADFLVHIIPQLKMHAEQLSDILTKQDIVAVMAHKTGIPMGKLQAGEKEKLLQIESYLQKRVVGQDQAIKAVSEAILESRSGLNKKGQPIGSFFLLGPTGTGKTELAKSIAEFLFNDEKAMIRFDMSEFKEEHSAALLYGAPPGYVGYEEGGLLVNKIRQQPYSVLLFDEIEKAHPSVFDTFLQILDEGMMHDRLGKAGDFSNSLILFTSNIGSEWIAGQIDAGKGFPTHNQLMEIMTAHFRPEFLARIAEIVPFAPISTDHIVKIFDIQLQQLIQLLDKQGVDLVVTAEAKQAIAMKGFTPKYGARQLAAGIRNELRRPISKMLIAGELNKGDILTVGWDASQEILTWEIKQK